MTAADPAGLPLLPARSRLTIPAIDGFRGVAALTVVAYHCFLGAGNPQLDDGPVRAMLAAGYLGVDFFFVISGFVLFLPAVLNGGDIGHRRSYLLRRVARIVPGYYVFLFIAVALTPVFVKNNVVPLPHESFDGVMVLVSHLTLVQHHLGRFFGESYALIFISWTLTLEALFYILLPFVSRSFHRHPFRWLAGALVVSTAWKIMATNVVGSLSWLGAGGWDAREVVRAQVILVTQFPSYVAHFALGMTAAWAFVRLRDLPRNRPRQLSPRIVVALQLSSVVAILLAIREEGTRVLNATGTYYGAWTRPTYIALFFAVLLVATALAPTPFQWPLANPVARWLGDVSYGTYLAHPILVIVAIFGLDLLPGDSWTAFLRLLAFVAPASVLAAWLSFTLVERPARHWAAGKSRAWAERDGGEPAPAAPGAEDTPAADPVAVASRDAEQAPATP